MLSMIENLFSFEYILKYIFWEAEKKSTDYSLEYLSVLLGPSNRWGDFRCSFLFINLLMASIKYMPGICQNA